MTRFLLAFGLLATLFGCGGSSTYRLKSFGLERQGWDTLRIDPDFVRGSLFTARPVVPDSFTVHVLDGADTLFAGFGGRGIDAVLIPVPDRRLGNEARFLVEVCGFFSDGPTLCEQEGLTASPKRISALADVSYPHEGDREKGRYRLQWVVERQKAKGSGWEPVRAPRPRGVLRVFIPPHTRDAVEVPLVQTEGAFDLSRRPGYDNFWIRLHDRLMDADSVDVQFDVLTASGSALQPVTSLLRRVRARSDAERQEDVDAFMYHAEIQLLDVLKTARDGRANTVAYEWHYNRMTQRYRIELEVSWRGGFLMQSRYAVRGTLDVKENGQDARFTAADITSDLQPLWDLRIGSATVGLGTLPLEVPPDLLEPYVEE